MSETAKLRKLITKRGTLEILVPLCCTNPIRHKRRQAMKEIWTLGSMSQVIAKIAKCA